MKTSLKELRELRGWSQERLAKVIGVSTRTISRWEHGKGPTYEYYRQKLAIVFELPQNRFIGTRQGQQ